MSRENPLWGAPRIHGELLMLGIEVAESTVGRYMVRRRRPPSQDWKPSLRSRAAGIASVDPSSLRTISFKPLSSLVTLRHARRRLVYFATATGPLPSLHPSHSGNENPRSSDRPALTGGQHHHRGGSGFDEAQEPRPEQSESPHASCHLLFMFAIGEMRTWSTSNCHAIACKRFVLDAEQGTRFLKKSEREAGLNSRGSEPRCPSFGHLPSAESTRDHRRMLRAAILFTFLFGTCVAVREVESIPRG
jgi:hypothetical protein